MKATREKERITVAIISRNCLFAEVIGNFLSRQRGVVFAGTIRREQLSSDHQSWTAEVVLINFDVSINQTVRFIHRLKRMASDLKVIVLNAERNEDDRINVKFIEAGATACLSQDESPAQLVDLIKLVHSGETLCSPRTAALIFSRVHELARQNDCAELSERQLTEREKEVLQLIAAGLRNKEIAEELNISESTVKNHVHKMLEKLAVHSRRKAIELAYHNIS